MLGIKIAPLRSVRQCKSHTMCMDVDVQSGSDCAKIYIHAWLKHVETPAEFKRPCGLMESPL